ncbi:carbonyl reductase [Polychaeton citri CBS 116435]|uniref:Carbonyl reductase n=1 Tax=Polychaeton citri CBS 116435 TaxID=1314669 RepID=A0A9P4PZW5_9PEZI|nr:carbonyl reductase [Polychaeton citri CBS 116435]
MSRFARIAVVTGANKGIGYGLALHLALRYPCSRFNTGHLLVILTARDPSRGQHAIDQISSDERLTKARILASQGGLVSFEWKLLDISSRPSIDAFVRDLAQEHNGIDILVNNAGIEQPGFDMQSISATLLTNFHGTVYLSTTILPHLRKSTDSRLVNIASVDGVLDDQYSEEMKARFHSAARNAEMALTLEEAVRPASRLMSEFEALAALGPDALTHAGFPRHSYAVSKAGLIAATRCIALKTRHSNTSGEIQDAFPLVVSCCPGWVRTDLTHGRGDKDVTEGVVTPLHVMLQDIGHQTGDFWSELEVVEW